MSKKVNAIPEGFHTVTPALVVRNAAKAIDFYKRAFDAKEVMRFDGPNGTIMHAELRIGDSVVMLSDEFPDWGAVGPETIGGTPVTLYLYVEDCDAVYEQAVAAGATSKMAPTEQFWGDRYAGVSDPFGHSWSVLTRVKNFTKEEIEQAATAAMGSQQQS